MRIMAFLLLWLVRGSAYGIGLCLQGQLRVPMEGARVIGRGAVAASLALAEDPIDALLWAGLVLMICTSWRLWFISF